MFGSRALRRLKRPVAQQGEPDVGLAPRESEEGLAMALYLTDFSAGNTLGRADHAGVSLNTHMREL